ncbi:MAG: helix-turn-helix transcriptional regulator [Alphaproteobacteria bacterium]|nr:helix-turn-helix transcriptional regulator [Alphaproteobacteria bacterium]
MTPDLVRAARGFLNWQQRDLADTAGLSLSAVNNYERNKGKTRDVTIQAMVGALEAAGIEFLPHGAIRKADETASVQTLTGPDFIQKMNEDMYNAIRTPGQEIFTCSTDESQWFEPNVKEASQRYYAWRKKMAARELYLVAEGNTVFESAKQNYRFLPANLIGKITYCIYTDRIALISWRKKQAFILRGDQLVEPFREQFKFLWRLGRKA